MRFARHLWAVILALPIVATAQQPGANRLAKETSPYLLQHAHNPVDWYPWGDEAFAKAKAEGKPIFLSVGYSSCYWCHVMERECFEDAAIAKLLNEHFIAVKVDREERPDVDAVYMAALRAYSGGGGWPMSMFLRPDGLPFFGGTYFPATEKRGLPGFGKLLVAVHDAWKDHREEIDRDAENLAEAARKLIATDAKRRAPLSREIAREGVSQLAEQYDAEFGGFGFSAAQPNRPKFPEPVNLAFLLDRVRRQADAPGKADPMAMVTFTLDRMARGGLRDHLAGGFHRYTVDRRWAVPHFEKMLYDNAQLASAYLNAFAIDKDPRWEREARATFAFVERSMTGPEGGFFSALDAEAEAEEGKTYVWSRTEIRKALGDVDAEVFQAVYGLDLDPNFEEGRYVLQLPKPLDEAAKALGTTPEALEAQLVPMRAKLLAIRDARPQPRLDDKILTGWNGLMIAAYADGFRILKDETYRRAAEKAADFLWTTLRDRDGRLLRSYRAGRAKGGAYLEDYAFLAHGLLRLHAATGEATRLDQAKTLVDRLLADFQDDANGGFYATARDHETLFARPKDPYDNALPGGNGLAILDLVELGTLTGEAKYLDAAGRALDAFSAVLQRAPASAPIMVVALEAYLDARPAKAADPLAAFRPKLDGADLAESIVSAEVREIEGKPESRLLVLTIRDGWHLYANPSGSPNAGPTTVAVRGEAAQLVAVDYPPGEAEAALDTGPAARVYRGKVEIPVRVRFVGPFSLRVTYQACDDRRCLEPTTIDVPVR